jgi:hypothetical protein
LDIIASEGPIRSFKVSGFGQLERGGQHTAEEEIDVIANDLTIEERGRIERGGALGIVGGGWERISESGNLSVEPWSEVIEI